MPAEGRPAQVCWLFAKEDEALALELLRFAAVLESQGLIVSWSPIDLGPSQSLPTELASHVRSADVIMLLLSPSLNTPSYHSLVEHAATSNEHARVVPVILRPAFMPPELASLQALPRDGQPIMGRRNRDEVLLEVIRGLQEIVTFRPASSPEIEAARGIEADSLAPASSQGGPAATINDIFRLNGPPTFTFVEPPQFPVLRLELRTMGTGLIVEGPSKIGKSTAIRKAMESLGVAEGDQTWWFGQRPPSKEEFRRKLDDLLEAKKDTWLFIDDFHHLEDDDYRRTLAFAMKALADQPKSHGKVTLIGINPLGNSLAQVMPDLAGRFRILRIDLEKDWKGSTKIAELIVLGERAANVRFKRRDQFVVAAAGSFFIAQLLCNRAAVQAGIEGPQRRTVDIDLGPTDVLAAIQGELAARYRAPLLHFAAFDVKPPPRGAGLSLLWLLTRNADGFVSLKEARLRFPMLGGTFDWFLESNLSGVFQEHPELQGLLYFNRATATLTMEDPQLKFYLRELNWEEFAEASGHAHVSFHSEDGPVWPVTAEAAAQSGHRGARAGAPAADVRRVLHLSDLHFSNSDQATGAYAQLSADLRQQQVTQLDALVVSGDLVNRALPTEYEAARFFLEQLMTGFELSARQVVLVPGNHDVSWSLSQSAYALHWRANLAAPPPPEVSIEQGPDAIAVRDEEAYQKRFQPFAEFYRRVKGVEYSLEYVEQGTLDDLSESGLCILGLNSAWQIDHHYRDRADIHVGALSRALLELGQPLVGQLRIAVFHHPLHSGEDSRLRDAAFLQQLAVQGFRLVLHGHVHKADAALYRYDRSAGGRQIDVVAAGTFGAPVHEWVPGYPLQYNLLLVGQDRITVETRCRREVNGAWEPDARWQQGPGLDPLPRYFLER